MRKKCRPKKGNLELQDQLMAGNSQDQCPALESEVWSKPRVLAQPAGEAYVFILWIVKDALLAANLIEGLEFRVMRGGRASDGLMARFSDFLCSEAMPSQCLLICFCRNGSLGLISRQIAGCRPLRGRENALRTPTLYLLGKWETMPRISSSGKNPSK